MKEITLDKFKQDPEGVFSEILAIGDIYSVDTGKGKVMLLEEAEYNILRESFGGLMGLATAGG